ncbi:D-aminoacyl-tRNA deacylase [Lachnospiraceae bacterium JLR.KK008]
MKFVIQRVSQATVTVDGKTVGTINHGYVVLAGISNTDTKQTAEKMTQKMLRLRIFEDSDGKTNLSLKDVNGEILIISQFTLYADCRKGNRPSFINAGQPELANALYEYIISLCEKECPVVRHGIFGADMKVSLVNDGPFTIVLDSEELLKDK